MARKARKRSESQIYHILLRGMEKQDIFIDDEDKSKMTHILKGKKKDNAFFLYAYCILSNHMHLLIREGNDDISRILKRAATSYAIYFNKKYSRSGRVFQDRFKSEAVNDEKFLMPIIRFIHQNPVKAGIAYLDDYYWSSYSDYVCQKEGLTDFDGIFDLISKDRNEAIGGFIKYNRTETEGSFIDIADEKEIDKENIDKYIKSYLDESTLTIEDLKKPESKKVRDSMIIYLLESSNLSRRNIAEILGINRETVRKAGLSKRAAD